MPDWYGQWAARHCTVFGIADEAGLAMVLSWRDLFSAAGYSAADLEIATDWLALNDPPRFRTEHLPAIQGAVRRAKAVAYVQGRELLEDPRGTCTLCGSTGWVTVPHPAGVREGEWRPVDAGAGPFYYTCAVLCACALGAWAGQHIREDERRKGPPLRLGEYESINPRWKVQTEQRRLERLAKGRLGPVDPVWDARVREMLKRAGAQLNGR